jgi:hypothetical protein
MSKVVPFPSPARGTDQDGPSTAKANIVADRRVRAQRIEENLKREPRLKTVGQRRIVGRNLWNILDRIESHHGKRKAEVVAAFKPGEEHRSTKLLWHYTLSPNLGEKACRNRAERMAQEAGKYAKIARVAARLAGLPEDECLCDLFSGTSYVEPAGGTLEAEPWAEILSGLLNAMGRAIARDLDLAGYFAFIARHALWRDQESGEFRQGISYDLTLHDLADGIATNDHHICALLPKVFLSDNELGRAKAEIAVSPEPEPIDAVLPRCRSRLGGQSADACPFDDASRLPGLVRIERFLWLCLAPIGAGNEVVPAFMERRHFHAWAEAESRDPFRSVHYTSLGEPPRRTWVPLDRPRKTKEAPRFVDALYVKGALPEARTPSWATDEWASHYYYIESVTPLSCQRFLNMESYLQFWDDPDQEEDPDHPLYSPTDLWSRVGLGECPPHTLAAEVEDNLYHADEQWSVEHRLARAAARRVEALAAWRREEESFTARRRDELLRRWSREP